MAKKRVHEIAREKGIPSKEVIAKLQAAGLDVKAAASSVDEVLLTLSINTGARALRDIAENYAFLKECKVVVTKLDEVASWGNALNIAVYTGKPITYVTTGQSVPDDIEQMDAGKIAANILGQGATA